MKREVLVVVALICSLSALAGDLDALPDNEGALREKIRAFIKPGGKVKDAVSLLESSRFKCKELGDSKNTLWCDRWDGNALSSVKRRYQVSIETQGALVKSVEAFTGLVGT